MAISSTTRHTSAAKASQTSAAPLEPSNFSLEQRQRNASDLDNYTRADSVAPTPTSPHTRPSATLAPANNTKHTASAKSPATAAVGSSDRYAVPVPSCSSSHPRRTSAPARLEGSQPSSHHYQSGLYSDDAEGEEEDCDYDSDATLDIDDPSVQLADKGFPLRRMSESYAVVLAKQLRQGKLTEQEEELSPERSLRGHRWSICVPRSTPPTFNIDEAPEEVEEEEEYDEGDFGDDESEDSGDLDFDSDSQGSFLSFGDEEDEEVRNIREHLDELNSPAVPVSKRLSVIQLAIQTMAGVNDDEDFSTPFSGRASFACFSGPKSFASMGTSLGDPPQEAPF